MLESRKGNFDVSVQMYVMIGLKKIFILLIAFNPAIAMVNLLMFSQFDHVIKKPSNFMV